MFLALERALAVGFWSIASSSSATARMGLQLSRDGNSGKGYAQLLFVLVCMGRFAGVCDDWALPA